MTYGREKLGLPKEYRMNKPKQKRRAKGILGERKLWSMVGNRRRFLYISVSWPYCVEGQEEGTMCDVSFRYSGRCTTLPVPGIDVLDVIQNVFVVIASELFLRWETEGIVFKWGENGEAGFPDFPALRLKRLPPLRSSEVNTELSDGMPSQTVADGNSFGHLRYSLDDLLSQCAPGDLTLRGTYSPGNNLDVWEGLLG
jgi:hypothetical protein